MFYQSCAVYSVWVLRKKSKHHVCLRAATREGTQTLSPSHAKVTPHSQSREKAGQH